MPLRPISCSASFTSSSLKGLMTASIFFMRARTPVGTGAPRDAALSCWCPDASRERANRRAEAPRARCRFREQQPWAVFGHIAQRLITPTVAAVAHLDGPPLVAHMCAAWRAEVRRVGAQGGG